MTPAARIAAAIEVLDQVVAGQPAEQALTRWARQNRYAGSKDRAAVRDHVFACLRKWRLAAHLGGAETGRGLMIGLLRTMDLAPECHFTGERHAPKPLSAEERLPSQTTPPQAVTWNLPDWLLPEFQRSLGIKAEATAMALQHRAPVTLRVNISKISPEKAVEALANEGIEAEQNPVATTALTVLSGERKVRQSRLFQSGQIELQDASSQAVVALLPDAQRPLDYCAGGGGKALAIAARLNCKVFAHDIEPRRMSDLPRRAQRAGAEIGILTRQQISKNAEYDLILCDVPCSGSGAWRRSPEGKWLLTQEKLNQTCDIQDDILDSVKHLLKPGGVLAYATCSVLRCENEDRVEAFLDRHPECSMRLQKRFDVTASGDGFFTAHLTID